MAKILVLAASGFGKSTSIGAIESLGIKGLNPEQTFVVSCTTKPLPFPRSAQLYKVVEGLNPPTAEAGNRVISNDAGWIAKCIDYVIRKRPEIKNIVIDDMNYIMQDYYMANSLKQGYDTFKKTYLSNFSTHPVLDVIYFCVLICVFRLLLGTKPISTIPIYFGGYCLCKQLVFTALFCKT